MKKFILIFAIAVILPVGAIGKPFKIDLNSLPAYARQDFSVQWLNEIPEDLSSWKKIEPSKTGKRVIRIMELGFPDQPEKKFLSFREEKPRDYTILIPIELSEKDFSDIIPGMIMGSIGINWEIYVNGIIIGKEVFLDDNGFIKVHRTLENVVIPIKSEYLKNGTNLIAFRIIGNPVSRHTGFHWGEPFLFGNYQELLKLRAPVIPLILICIYLFIGVYHLFLFILRKKDYHNLMFALVAISVFVYMFVRSDYARELVQNTMPLIRMEFSVLYTIIPFFGFFIELILLRKISRFTWGYAVFSIILIAFTVWPPQTFIQDILLIWQITCMVPLSYYLFYVLGGEFYRQFRNISAKIKDDALSWPIPRALGRTFYDTTAGNLIIGVNIAALGLIFDVLDSAVFGLGVILSQYSFFLLIVSIMLVLANRFQYIHKRIEILNSELMEKIDDLNAAYKQKKSSEERYRLLVEGSHEIIFTMTPEGRLINANRSIKKYLGVDPEHVSVLSIYNLLHLENDKLAEQLLKDNLENLKTKRQSATLRLPFIRRLSGLPLYMILRLDYLERADGFEILGKATPADEDTLISFFRNEKQSYIIESYLTAADDMSHRMTRNIKRYLPENEIMTIRMALREIIVNAIEHGNLGITWEEKTAAQEEERLFELIMERQMDPAYKSRKVTIDYSINDQGMRFRITDEGEGFDYRKIIADNSERANEEMLQHGRGISIASSIFDSVTYNKKGNQVLLVKNFITDENTISPDYT